MADFSKLIIEVDSSGVVTATSRLNANAVAAQRNGQAVSSLHAKWSKFGKTLTRVGKNMTRYVTLPLVGLGAVAVKLTNDLNKGMANVQTLIPDNPDKVYAYRDAIKALSSEVGKSHKDLTGGLYQVISAYGDSSEAIQITELSAKSATAGIASTTDALNLLSAVTKAYGDTTYMAQQKVADLAFKTVKLGQTTFPEMAASIQLVTNRSQALGVSQEELFTVFATLTGVTGNASMVATQFRSALTALTAPTETLQGLYNRLGVSSGASMVKQYGLQKSFQLIQQDSERTGVSLKKYIGRIEGMTAVSSLSTNMMDVYGKKLKEVSEYAGSADEAFDAQTQGINKVGFSMTQAKMDLANLATTWGELLLPTIEKFLIGLKDVTTSFDIMDDASKKTIIRFTGIAATIGPLLLLLGSLIKVVLSLKTAITMLGVAAGPVGAIFAGLAIALGVYASATASAIGSQVDLAKKLRMSNKAMDDAEEVLSKMRTATDGVSKGNVSAVETYKKLVAIYPSLKRGNDDYIESNESVTKSLEGVLKQALENQYTVPFATMEALSKKLTNFEDQVERKKKDIEYFKKAIKDSETTFFRNLQTDNLKSAEGQLARLQETAQVTTFDMVELQDTINADMREGWQAKLVDGVEVISRIVKTSKDGGEDAISTLELVSNGIDETNITLAKGAKAWEDWFEKITGIDKGDFSEVYKEIVDGVEVDQIFRGSGAKAGQVFVASLEQEMLTKMNLAEMVGASFDEGEGLSTMIASIESVIGQLTSITANEITNDDPFKLKDESIKELIKTLKLYYASIKKITSDTLFSDMQNDITAVEELNDAFDNVNTPLEVLEDQLAIVEGVLESLFDDKNKDWALITRIEEVRDALKDAKEVAEEDVSFDKAQKSAESFVDFLEEVVYEALVKTTNLSSELSQAIASMVAQIADITISSTVSAFESLGDALAKGADAGTTMKEVLVNYALQLLDMLPMMFVQAGLTLLAQNNPMGWGLLAAGLSTAFINGFTKGAIEKATKDKQDASTGNSAHAHGNAFGSNIVPFARGGSFTNSIVDTPTRFRFSQGAGLMGEAGPEGILPLTRTPSGDLGVHSTGGGTILNLIVNNNSSAQVKTKETDTPDGKDIEILIVNQVKKAVANGHLDKQMTGRFNTSVKGVAS